MESLRSLVGDLRYGLRLLRVEPALPTLAAATLALSLGATTALLAILDAVFVHPVRYRSPDQLVRIGWTDIERPSAIKSLLALTPPDASRWQNESAVFAAIGVSGSLAGPFVTVVDEPLERFATPRYQAISPGFLDVYQVAPSLGRVFGHSDMTAGATIVLIGDEYWRRRYGRSPHAIGSQITFTGGVATVVGVLPSDFFPDTELWLPLPVGRTGAVHGRLRPEARSDAILSELKWRARDFSRSADQSTSLRPIYLSAEASRRVSVPGLTILTLSVVLTMTLVVINLGGLFLMRGLRRQRELTVRAACGAGPARLRRQLITESVAIALVSGLIGMACAPLFLSLIVASMPRLVPPHADPRISAATLLTSIVVAILSGTLIGLLPAIRLAHTASARPSPPATMTSTKKPSRRMTGTLICAQTALSVILLGLVSLLILDLGRTVHRDPGVPLDNLVRLAAEPIEWTPDAWTKYYPALVTALRQMPEIEAVGAVSSFPGTTVAARQRIELVNGAELSITSRAVLPGYLDALGMRVIAGTLPTDADRIGVPGVVLNEAAVKQMVRAGVSATEPVIIRGVPHRVLAVVENTIVEAPLGDVEPAMYQLYGDRIDSPMTVMMRLKGQSPGLARRIQGAARSLGLPAIAGEVMPGPSFIWQESTVRTQVEFLRLLGAWSILSMCIVATGIAGITAHAVAARSRELAIRVALGATPTRVLWISVGDSLGPMILGVVIGLGGAALSSTAFAGLLVNVSRREPAGYISATVALLAVGLGSAWMAARRVTRLDPVCCLRDPE